MPACCILGCGAIKNKYQPKLTIHSFPKNEIWKKKWLEIIGPDNINPRVKVLRVCSLHFEKSCFIRTNDVIRLRDGSVPSSSLLPNQKYNQLQPRTSIVMDSNFQDLSATCRVCLASEREMHRLTNTPLEETYERVTSETLVVEGRPCCVCGVCLSALRRCRRFIDTAREANDALDRWIRNPNTDRLKLAERPLFFLTQTPMEVFEVTCQEDIVESGLEQESDTAENFNKMPNFINDGTCNDESNILTEEIKYEVTNEDENDSTHVSDGDSDSTHVSDGDRDSTHVSDGDSDSTHVSDGDRDSTHVSDGDSDSTHVSDGDCDSTHVLDGDSDSTHVSDGDCDSTHVSDGDSDETYMSDNEASNSSSSSDSINMQEERIDFEMLKQFDEVRINIINLNDVESVPCTSNIERDYPTTTEVDLEKPLLLRRSRKKVKPNEDTISDPVLKKRRPTTSKHRRGNTDPAVAEHKKQLFSCRQCSYKNADNNLLIAHRKIHAGEKRFLCDKCDFKCKKKYGLKKHLMTHTGEKPYACDLCDYKSSHTANIKRHVTTHTGEKRFACDNCDYHCKRRETLKFHIIKHHTDIIEVKRSNNEKSFACHKCDYKTWKRTYLSQHLMIHSGQKPFLCDMCGYRCIQKGSLLTHKKTHNGEQHILLKRLTCDKCDYKTFHKGNLIMHVKKHTGEKPLTCDMCDYKTFCKSNLKRHLLRHTGEKPFACDKCDYKCNQKSSLKLHTYSHTGEKRHICDKCDYKCTEKRSLYKHIKKVHADDL